MAEAWPAAVHQGFLANTWSETPAPSILQSEPEASQVPRERLRSSFIPTRVQFQAVYSQAEFDALETFYRATLGCVLPFERLDHPSQASKVFKFAAPPQKVGYAREHWRVSFDLWRLS